MSDVLLDTDRNRTRSERGDAGQRKNKQSDEAAHVDVERGESERPLTDRRIFYFFSGLCDAPHLSLCAIIVGEQSD